MGKPFLVRPHFPKGYVLNCIQCGIILTHRNYLLNTHFSYVEPWSNSPKHAFYVRPPLTNCYEKEEEKPNNNIFMTKLIENTNYSPLQQCYSTIMLDCDAVSYNPCVSLRNMYCRNCDYLLGFHVLNNVNKLPHYDYGLVDYRNLLSDFYLLFISSSNFEYY